MGKPFDSNNAPPVEAWLSGGGELGNLIRQKDWSQTPLGAIESWPQSLKTTLGILLHSRYPMFVFWGPQLVKIYNDAYRPITGHKHPWALGRPGYEVWPEIWSDIKPLVDRALAGDPTWSDDLLLFMERRGFPEEVYFTFSYSPVSDESGGIGGMFCACTETTAEVLGERRLRILRDLAAAPAEARTVADACLLSARALETNAADVPFAVVYLADEHGTFHLMCQTGLAAGDPAAPLTIDVRTSNTTWPVPEVAAARHAEQVESLGERFERLPPGPWPEPPASAVVLPLIDRGLERGVGAIVLGLSSRRPYDADYREWCELVAAQVSTSMSNARAVEDERRRAEALAEIDRAKTEFFSNVSHEFRTPLTLLLGPIEDALSDGVRNLQGEALETAHRNALRLLKLVNSLLDFSRLEAGRVTARFEPVDLAALTADLASVFRTAIEKAGLTLVVDCALERPVYVDRDMWEKIVLNLLSNALKYTFEGTIAVTLNTVDERPVLAVRDSGIGIAPEELPHLFERFHRVKGARARTHEGTGIGLALVRELVKLHDGQIHVESTPGEGSTFTVSLPFGDRQFAARHNPPGAAHTSSPTAALAYVEEALRWLPSESPPATDPGHGGLSASPAEPVRPSSRGAHIVVADDNADMLDYVERLLRPHWSVEAVRNGRTALEAIRRHPPDLVLTDAMMPGLDGFELLDAIRSNDALRHVPVIMLSARAGEKARVEGLRAGADDYLVKPFGARELIARVEAAIELSRVRREGQERLGVVNRDLRNRIAELETLLNVIPVGIGIALDRECRTIQANPAFAATLGVPSNANASLTAPENERPTSFRVVDVNGNEVAPENLPMQVAAREGREVLNQELRVIHKEGRLVHLLEYAAPLFDEFGSPRGAIGAFIDVTERRQAEGRNQFLVRFDEAVRVLADPAAIMALASELLGAQLGVSRCAYGDVDLDGEHVMIPHEYMDRDGYRPLVGRWRLSWLDDDSVQALRGGTALVVRDVARERPEAAAAAATFSIGATICAAALRGNRLSALMAVHSTSPRHWRKDEIELVELAAARCWESIERARALRELADSESRFRTMADNAPVLVWVTEPDGRCSFLSKTWYEFTGQTAESALGLGWLEATHPDDRAQTQAVFREANERREPFRMEYRLRRYDGEYRWVIDSAAPRYDSGGELRGFIGSVIDITDRKQLEASLVETNRLKDEFLATLSHEVRTPLNAVLGWTHMLRRGALSKEVRHRALDSIQRNANAQAKLIDELLDISRAIAGKLQLARTPVDVKEVVTLATETIQPTAINKGVDLHIRSDRQAQILVTGDADRLRQIVWNLLSNAVKFTPAGGRVDVHVRRDGEHGEIVVRDTGQGIDSGFLPFVFDRFRQADGTTTRRHGGLGLGLAIARHLTEAHGGTITAASEGANAGAVFTVRLPLTSARPAQRRAPRSTGSLAVLEGARLLVVDDEADTRELLQALLEAHGAEVSLAESAGEALHRLQNDGRFDALLADIGMPDQDGYALIRAVRSLPDPQRSLPAVAVTAYTSAVDRALALDAGYGWHLPKPVQPDEVVHAVWIAIGGRERTPRRPNQGIPSKAEANSASARAARRKKRSR